MKKLKKQLKNKWAVTILACFLLLFAVIIIPFLLGASAEVFDGMVERAMLYYSKSYTPEYITQQALKTTNKEPYCMVRSSYYGQDKLRGIDSFPLTDPAQMERVHWDSRRKDYLPQEIHFGIVTHKDGWLWSYWKGRFIPANHLEFFTMAEISKVFKDCLLVQRKDVTKITNETIIKAKFGKRYGYIVSDNDVWYKTSFIATKLIADPKTFKVIDKNRRIAKDKSHIYYKGKILLEADSESFTLFEGKNPYAKDKDKIFHIPDYNNVEPKILAADINTFVVVKDYFAKDKNHVYKNGEIFAEADASTFKIENGIVKDKNNIYLGGEILSDADPATFKAVGDDEYPTYYKDNNKVWFVWWSDFNEIKNVDPGSFEPLKYYYSKDKTRVFYKDQEVIGADPNTFEAITYFSESKCSINLGKDSKNIYLFSNVLEYADPNNFVVLSQSEDEGFTARSGNTFYAALSGCDLQAFPEIDPDTAKILSYYIIKDKNAVYTAKVNNTDEEIKYRLIKIPEADPATFEYFDYGFYRDKQFLFRGENPHHYLPTDGLGSLLTKLEDIDVNSAVFADPYVYNKKAIYCNGKRLYELDAATFKILDYGYSTDGKTVFYKCMEVKEIKDATTFEIVNKRVIKDKYNIFRREDRQNYSVHWPE